MNSLIGILILITIVIACYQLYNNCSDSLPSRNAISDDKLKLLHLFATELIILREYTIRFVNKLGNQADLLQQLKINNYHIIMIVCKNQPASKQLRIKELFENKIDLLDKLLISMVTNNTDNYINISDQLVNNIESICKFIGSSNCEKIYLDYIANLDQMLRELVNHRTGIESYVKINNSLGVLAASLIK